MKAELENNLAREFEFMRREALSADSMADNLYEAFGIDTGDGWYQLLYDMCREITEVLETAGKPLHIVVDQIKEKYGILRFYYHFEDAEPGWDDVHQKIALIVEKYEDKSESVCEICGREGTLRTDLRWIQTLCDACYSKCIGRERCV